MTTTPPTTSGKWPRRRVLVVAAEILLVVALVVLNLYLWIRPGPQGEPSGGATRANAGASSFAAPVASSASGPQGSQPQGSAGSAGPPTTPAATKPTTGSTSPASASGTSGGNPAAALRSAGRLVVVVDTSPAMADQLPAVRAGLLDLARQAPDGVAMGLCTYGPNGVQVLAPAEPLDGTRRTSLQRAVQDLGPTGGTPSPPSTESLDAAASAPTSARTQAQRPLFDALILGYQYALAGPPGTDRAPILLAITNGGRVGGADLVTFATFARTEAAKRARSATPRFIGITPGADMSLLTRTVAAVGGAVVAVDDPRGVPDAMLDLPAPRPVPSTAGSPSS